mmetsp:Transcript_41503/g.90487  ORF Transcript_41503/g.90487 Transcript_41503/m.90487 type:complete len:335 (-) Transcript_41503:806-1810(-)
MPGARAEAGHHEDAHGEAAADAAPPPPPRGDARRHHDALAGPPPHRRGAGRGQAPPPPPAQRPPPPHAARLRRQHARRRASGGGRAPRLHRQHGGHDCAGLRGRRRARARPGVPARAAEVRGAAGVAAGAPAEAHAAEPPRRPGGRHRRGGAGLQRRSRHGQGRQRGLPRHRPRAVLEADPARRAPAPGGPPALHERGLGAHDAVLRARRLRVPRTPSGLARGTGAPAAGPGLRAGDRGVARLPGLHRRCHLRELGHHLRGVPERQGGPRVVARARGRLHRDLRPGDDAEARLPEAPLLPRPLVPLRALAGGGRRRGHRRAVPSRLGRRPRRGD